MMLKVIKGDDETFDMRIYIEDVKWVAIEQDNEKIVVFDAQTAADMIKTLRKAAKKLGWKL
tara:strand:- start:79 stop:261 length:183 start_codon:yes stop_codon:yes gene_type:complete